MIDLFISLVLALSLGTIDLECTFYAGTDTCVGCTDDCLEPAQNDGVLESTVNLTEA